MRASIVLLLIATACSSGGTDSNTTPVQPTGDVAPPPPPPAPEPVPEPPPVEGSGPAASNECKGPPPSAQHVCVQDCGPPVAKAGDPPPGWSWLSPEQAENRKKFGCPICLPHDARIATPSGAVEIDALEPGDVVWTLDANEQRVRARVALVLSTPVPHGHQLAVIGLADGRTLRASPGHPDAGGRAVGTLALGDRLDRSQVRRVQREPYEGRTYDLVLDHGRHYWADGVLVESSLR